MVNDFSVFGFKVKWYGESEKWYNITKNGNVVWFLSDYGIALILYIGLNGLIVNSIGNTFPNAKFMMILALTIIVAWSMGLGVRHYLNSFTNVRLWYYHI